MRLFIAVNFDKNLKKDLQDLIEKIKAYSVQARFVSKEHMHLTMEFLGEIPDDKVVEIKDSMDKLQFGPFNLNLSEMGLFNRKDGDIYWFGIVENPEFKAVHGKLHELLLEKGFKLDDREYTPHLTIGRNVKMEEIFNPDDFKEAIKKLMISVSSIDLMKSENVNGKLTYTKIYSKELTN